MNIVKKKILGVIFSRAPYGASFGEEGLELIISSSIFFKKIYIFFISDGIFQIFYNQKPKLIFLNKYTNLFKMFNFLNIKKCFSNIENLYNRGILKKNVCNKIVFKKYKFILPIILLKNKNLKKKNV
ncbi:Protein TusC [Buchnera aphidicola (Drepanosiphum platanoidis)]